MLVDDPAVAENLDELSLALSHCKDPVLIRSFLESLLTPSETADVAARWALVKELKQGTVQREIAKKLGISLCKITRGSRELKKENSPFEAMLALIEP